VPPALLSRDEVIDKLMLVVRRSGYDGASLAELSKATGLGKSSLYHYFPNGKDDMVRAVLDHLATQLRDSVFTPLRARGPARRRVEGMVTPIDEYYRGGRESCILGNLVLGTSRTRFRPQLKAILDEWIDALAAALVDGGLTRAIARARAEDAVIRIEGALILAGAMGDVSLFQRSLKQMPSELLVPNDR
jgi:TetR/AcrR family transcriptional regulator, lmrAB and yxaGH operons repressor